MRNILDTEMLLLNYRRSWDGIRNVYLVSIVFGAQEYVMLYYLHLKRNQQWIKWICSIASCFGVVLLWADLIQIDLNCKHGS